MSAYWDRVRAYRDSYHPGWSLRRTARYQDFTIQHDTTLRETRTETTNGDNMHFNIKEAFAGVKSWQLAVAGGVVIAVVGYVLKNKLSSGSVTLTPNAAAPSDTGTTVVNTGGSGAGGGDGSTSAPPSTPVSTPVQTPISAPITTNPPALEPFDGYPPLNPNLNGFMYQVLSEAPSQMSDYTPYQETQIAQNTPGVTQTGTDGLGNPVVQGPGIFQYYGQLLQGRPPGSSAYPFPGAVSNPPNNARYITAPFDFSSNGQ